MPSLSWHSLCELTCFYIQFGIAIFSLYLESVLENIFRNEKRALCCLTFIFPSFLKKWHSNACHLTIYEDHSVLTLCYDQLQRNYFMISGAKYKIIQYQDVSVFMSLRLVEKRPCHHLAHNLSYFYFVRGYTCSQKFNVDIFSRYI